jgi:hypothetical protein
MTMASNRRIRRNDEHDRDGAGSIGHRVLEQRAGVSLAKRAAPSRRVLRAAQRADDRAGDAPRAAPSQRLPATTPIDRAGECAADDAARRTACGTLRLGVARQLVGDVLEERHKP